MRAVALALVVVAGCHAPDPCSGKSGACLAIEVTGSGIGVLDELIVNISDAGGVSQAGGTGVVTPRIELPVQFATLLRSSTSGNLVVVVAGKRDQTVVASGMSSTSVPAGGHGRVTVTLSMDVSGPGDGGAGDGGAGGAGGGGGGTGNGTVALGPPVLDIGRVASGATGSGAFTVTATGDVTLGAAALTPAPTNAAIDPSSTCAGMLALHAGDTCKIVIAYSPTAPSSMAANLALPTTAGTLTALVVGRSPGTISETLPGSSPPTLNAVHAIDPRTVYAVGTGTSVWRRDPIAGWQARSGPASAMPLNAVWGSSDKDLYVVSSQSFQIFHSSDGAATWTALPGVTMMMGGSSVTGTDIDNVFVAGTAGDIVVGSANVGIWTNDHAPDSMAWSQVLAANGVVFGTRGDAVFIRGGASSWTQSLSAAGAASFRSVWGGSATDFYAVGVNPSCATSPCSVIYHKVGTNLPVVKSITGCDDLLGIFGTAGGTIYAVGLGGTIATSSGNDTWTTMSALTSAQLNAVHGFGGEYYAVGGAGTILHIIE